jgi:hypothetical protein
MRKSGFVISVQILVRHGGIAAVPPGTEGVFIDTPRMFLWSAAAADFFFSRWSIPARKTRGRGW